MRTQSLTWLWILVLFTLLVAGCKPISVPATPTATIPASTAGPIPPTETATLEPEPTPTPSATPTVSATPLPTAQAVDIQNYIQNCIFIDKIQNVYERQFALDQLAFPSELDAEAQASLVLPVIVKPSCNVHPGNTPRAIVIHSTRGALESTISEFQNPDNASIHYVIDRNGQVYQMVPEYLVAFHLACYGYRGGCLAACPICNDPDGKFVEPSTQSIGIELVNKIYVNPASFTGPIFEDYLESFGYRYWEDYPEAQIASLVVLVEDITARWGIPMNMIIGHYQVNDNVDPGPALNLFWWRNGNPSRPPIFQQP